MPKLFENLWVKIAAILLAILLWFHVATEKAYQIEISLPLTQAEIPDELVIAAPIPDSIRVLVSASGKKLLRSDWKHSGLKLVVSGNRAAKIRTEVSTSNLSLIKADKIDLLDVILPREIVLVTERKMQTMVPIISKLVVYPDDGYIVDENDSIVPASVTLAGPRNKIRDIKYIETVSKTIESVRDNFSSRIALNRPDIFGLVIEPDTVMAYFKVTPVKRKIFNNIPIKLINIPHGSSYNISPNNVDLRIAGKTETIDSISVELISAIADNMLADSNGVIPVQIVTPPSVSLLYKSIDSVKLIKDNADTGN
jgi:YbbR domain-containing protein